MSFGIIGSKVSVIALKTTKPKHLSYAFLHCFLVYLERNWLWNTKVDGYNSAITSIQHKAGNDCFIRWALAGNAQHRNRTSKTLCLPSKGCRQLQSDFLSCRKQSEREVLWVGEQWAFLVELWAEKWKCEWVENKLEGAAVDECEGKT